MIILKANFYGVRQKSDGIGNLIVQRKPIQRTKIENILDENLKKALKALPDSEWITKKIGQESISVLKNKDNESDEHGYIVHPTRRSKATHAWIKVDEISQDEWYGRKINKKKDDPDYGKTRLVLKSYGEVNKTPTCFIKPQKGLQLKEKYKAEIGQFLYKLPQTKKWEIQPIYTHVGEKQVLEMLKAKKAIIYNSSQGKPIKFETGSLIYIEKEHPKLSEKGFLPNKLYELSTLSDGRITWFNSFNKRDKIRSSLSYFVEAGVQRYYPDKVVET